MCNTVCVCLTSGSPACLSFFLVANCWNCSETTLRGREGEKGDRRGREGGGGGGGGEGRVNNLCIKTGKMCMSDVF